MGLITDPPMHARGLVKVTYSKENGKIKIVIFADLLPKCKSYFLSKEITECK